MEEKIGYRYIVKYRLSVKHWYPDQGGSLDKAQPLSFDGTFDMICKERDTAVVTQMVDTLITQDHGEQGVNEGRGTHCVRVIDQITYMGTVRL